MASPCLRLHRPHSTLCRFLLRRVRRRRRGIPTRSAHHHGEGLRAATTRPSYRPPSIASPVPRSLPTASAAPSFCSRNDIISAATSKFVPVASSSSVTVRPLWPPERHAARCCKLAPPRRLIPKPPPISSTRWRPQDPAPSRSTAQPASKRASTLSSVAPAPPRGLPRST